VLSQNNTPPTARQTPPPGQSGLRTSWPPACARNPRAGGRSLIRWGRREGAPEAAVARRSGAAPRPGDHRPVAGPGSARRAGRSSRLHWPRREVRGHATTMTRCGPVSACGEQLLDQHVDNGLLERCREIAPGLGMAAHGLMTAVLGRRRKSNPSYASVGERRSRSGPPRAAGRCRTAGYPSRGSARPCRTPHWRAASLTEQPVPRRL
jgi:hypothetical protein